MKKESSNKKSKLGLIIVIAVIALLAIVGVVLALTLGGNGGEAKEPEKLESKIYWNVDRESMLSAETGLSNREAAADGLWYIRFAVDGEQVELPVADRKLVNQIDLKDLLCLKFDADGIIIDAVDPTEVYTKIQDKVYVQAVDGSKVTLNTSMALNGMQINLTLPEEVGVWNVSSRIQGTVIGSATELEVLDQIIIFGTDEETPTDIFMTDRYWESKVYWRVSTRMYDSTNNMSSRKVADDGYWYIDFACEGEIKTYRTASQEVINALDGYGVNSACCGMVFNEDGDVIDCFNAGIAGRGTIVSNNFDVTAISDDGKTFTSTRVMFGTEIGKTYTATITEDTQIYNVSSTAAYVGEPTELQMDDRILVIARADGTPHTIFITNRMVDGPLYYNLNQKWSSTLGHTRTPDENGWYVFELAANGKVVTVRTKDQELASQMDAYSLKIFGLKLKGDVVVDVYDAVCVAGNYSFGSNNFVTSLSGGVLGTVSTSGTASNGVMTDDCKVFDVSNCYTNFKGEKTTLREGDQIIGYTNAQGEITHVWVLNRYVKGTTIYWNCNRYYANGETAREPDEDGYYVFNAIKLGTTEVVQLKTKDKNIASRFDKESSTTAAALKVSNGIIKAAYPAPAAIGGYYRLAGFWILQQTDAVANKWSALASTGAVGTLALADDCKIYNFSNLATNKGEKTTLKTYDRVWPIAGSDGLIHIIFVIERDVANSKLAFPYASCTTPDENGYYTYDLLINGKVGVYKTQDADIATFINGKLSQGCAVTLKGNIITGAYSAICSPDIRAAAISYYDVVSVKDGKINTQRNKVGASDVGNTSSLTLSSSYKAYMVDRNSETTWGSKVSLSKGDRVYAYTDNNGEVSVIFVAYECTLSGGNMRKCAHCGKTVHWENLTAGYAPAAGYTPEVAHYYVPYNMRTNSAYTFGTAVQAADGVNTEVVLDLNGKTIDRYTTTGNISGAVLKSDYGTNLIVTDYSSGKTGKIVAQEGALGTSAATLLHTASGSTMTIEGGVFDASKTSSNYTGANGGTVSVGGTLIVNGGTIYGRASSGNGSAIGGWGGSSIIVNGGTIIGNTVTKSISGTGYGGAICTNGDLTVTGGTIKGGTAEVGGDNIYFGKDANLTISGGTIDGGIQVASAGATVTLSGKPTVAEGTNYGLKSDKALVDATGLQKGASVYVDASGIFTTEFASEEAAQAALDNGMLKNGAETMMLARNGKAIEAKDDGQVHLWTKANQLPTSGNWKLDTDVTVASGVTLSGDLYIDLNNHTITNTGATPVVFSTAANKLTVDDTSATKGGTIKATTTEAGAFNAGLIYVGAAGQYVQHAGTLDGSNLTTEYTGANAGTLTISNGKIDGVSKYGSAIINGGTIKGWTTCGNGGAIGMMNLTSLTVNGGEIIGGTVTKSINGTGYGGAIMTGGHVTITGGTISGGSASENGDNIFVNNANAVVSIVGGEISGGVVLNNFSTATITGSTVIGEGDQYGLKLGTNKLVNMAGLTGEVHVDVFGLFSTPFTDAAAAEALITNGNVLLGQTQASDAEIQVDGTSLKVATASTIDPSVTNEWNAANAAEVLGGNVSDNLHKTNLPTSGKWKLTDSVTFSASVTMTGDMTLDLNGQTVTMTGSSYAIATAGKTLTIDDSSSAKQGTIKTVPTASTFNQNASVIYVSCGTTAGRLVLNNGIIDGTAVTNSKNTVFNGTVTLGNGSELYSSMEMNGGVIKGQFSASTVSDASGSAIGMMNGTTLVVNGGKIYGAEGATADTTVSAAGTTISAGKNGSITINGGELYGTRAVNHGGNIYTNGNLYINGGLISGGKAYNSGVICSAGTEMIITGGTITGGKNTLAARGNIIDKGAGTLIIKNATDGTAATIAGGISIRGGATLDISGNAVVDQTLNTEQEGNIFIMSGQTGTIKVAGTTKTVTVGTKYSLKYKCYTIADLVEGNDTVVQHNIVSGVCADCGYMDGAWTTSNALPTSGSHTLGADVTLSSATVLTGDLTLDLNGHTVTRAIASTETADMFAINTNGHKLVINDTSGKYGSDLGKIVATTADNFKVTSKAGLIYVPTGSVTVNNGIIDGSNLVHQAAGFAGVITTDTGSITVNGGQIYGMRNLGTATASSGATSSSNAGNCLAATAAGATVTVNGGTIVAPASTSSTDYVSGAGACIISKAPVTITGGELIGSRVANHGGVVYVDSNSLTMTGGVLKNGTSTNSGLVNCGGVSSITGGVLIGGNATSTSGLGGENIDFNGTQLTIGGDAIIGGGIGIRGSAKLILTGTPIINDGLQAEARGDIRIRAGQTSAQVYLNDTTGTPILTGATAEVLKDVEYNTDGTIKGVKAVAAAQTWTAGNALPTSGTWKLGADITLTSDDTSTDTIENCIVSTGDLVIDLNGHTITRAYAYNQGGYKYALEANHTVIITDTSTAGTGAIKTTATGLTYSSAASVVYTKAGRLILAGGTIDGSAVTNTYASATSGSVIVASGVKFTMIDGTIKGQCSTAATTGQGGGCVGGWSSSLFTMYGGLLEANTSDGEWVNYQGTCVSTSGDVVIHGGELAGGRAYSHGGTLYITGNFTMTGGLVHGGSSNNSGNVLVSGVNTTITGGVIIDGRFNKVESDIPSVLGGSNIDISGANAVAVIGGNAVIGGGVSTRNAGAKLTIQDYAVIDMNLQTQKCFDLRTKTTASANCGLYLGTTRIGGTAGAFYKLVRGLGGSITDIVAAN